MKTAKNAGICCSCVVTVLCIFQSANIQCSVIELFGTILHVNDYNWKLDTSDFSVIGLLTDVHAARFKTSYIAKFFEYS